MSPDCMSFDFALGRLCRFATRVGRPTSAWHRALAPHLPTAGKCGPPAGALSLLVQAFESVIRSFCGLGIKLSPENLKATGGI